MAGKDAPRGGLTSLGLQNRLLEVAVVVGMDEETGLKVRRNEKIQVPEASSLFDYHFQGHLLDILSGPQDSGKTASVGEVRWNALKRIASRLPNSQSSPTKPKPLQRGLSVRRLRRQANKFEEVPVSTDFLSNMPMLCLPEDSKVYSYKPEPRIHSTVLTDIDGFRHYATNLTFYREFHASKCDSMSWTLHAKTVEKSHEASNNNNNNGPTLCYVPCCVCFVSLRPYFSVLKDALSCFYKELMTTRSPIVRKPLEKYVTNLSLVVCPPSSLRMKFSLGGFPITLSPPAFPSKQESIIDIDLRLPLFIFMRQPTVLMDVLACIMHEQRIVFFSSNFTLLPLVMECFRCYIQPMEWHHQYIPILFSEIIAFVDCPGIFMMGCHSRHRAEIERIENDLFLVDLDHGVIHSNSHSSTETDGGSLGQFAQHMPKMAVQNLLKRLGDFELHNTITSVCQVNPVSLEEIKDQNFKMRQNLNRRIQSIFTEFMVDLFGTTLSFLDHERQQFKGDKFLESISPTDSPFYIKVSKSYMFQRFIRQRLARTTDGFSLEAEKRHSRRNSAKMERSRKQSYVMVNHNDLPASGDIDKPAVGVHRLSRELDPIQAGTAVQGNHVEPFSSESFASNHFGDTIDGTYFSLSKSCPSDDTSSEISIQMPTFPVPGTNFNAKHFYHRCVNALTDIINKLAAEANPVNSASHRAALLLLRGLYKLAEEDLVSGLQDLHATAKEDARYFPEKIIKTVVAALNDQELGIIQQNALFKNAPSFIKPRSHRTPSTVVNHMKAFFNDDNTAVYPLKKEPFTFVLEKNDITSDEKVISTLFKALCSCSDGETDEIQPDSFNAFYQTWHQLKSDCEKAMKSLSSDVRLPPDSKTRKPSVASVADDNVLSFQYDEQIIKVSATVQSSKGNGRLVLTTRRLIFISAGNQECKYVANLEDIEEVKISKFKVFLTSYFALFITNKNLTSSFKIVLKTECDLWIHLINEVKVGRKISVDQRDDHLSVNRAAQNVVLADAFHSAAVDEKSLDSTEALEWVSKLCRFKFLHIAGDVMTFSEETERMMLMRIDPSPKELVKAGIRGIAYSSADINETPHIWMILSSGKLRFIDTTTWNMDPKPIKDWDTKLNCVQLIQGRELWIGGDDGNIYVLSVTTVKVTRILHDHTSPIVAIIQANDNLTTSAADSGEVIIWNQSAVKVKFQAFHEPVNLVDFTLFKDYLCCCSTIYVVICDYEGHSLRQLDLGDSPRVVNSNLTCCAWEDNDEIWAGNDQGCIFAWSVPLPELSVPSSSEVEKKDEHEGVPITHPKLTGNIFVDAPITRVTKHEDQLWIGNELGEIVVFNTSEARQELKLQAHDGPVTSCHPLESRYMVSGSGEADGKLVIWKQLLG